MRSPDQQQGAVLILALILMVVLSVAGTAAMQLARLELQLGGSVGELSHSRQWVEAALLQLENDIVAGDFEVNPAGELCRVASSDCYREVCANGRCFFGNYVIDADQPDQCLLPPSLDKNEIFQDRSVWQDSNRHQRIDIEVEAGGETVPVLALVEWRCFTPLNSHDASNQEHRFDSAYWQPLFRLTAYTSGRNGEARLMAQTVVGQKTGRLSWREVPLLFAP
ncbi:pilus assembly PilX family protein [Saccharospirillum mangrovi]|uniref:pilus assembly PilX family protein n=1 Tax=Saccharospirillum mangrovi TaxID=2161747 RepID=UPI000D3C635A|nr:hypothetical protein [Saccharospirillum mangrovi]